jgi:hypothetical protein
MDTNQCTWVPTARAAELLHVSASMLRQLKAAGVLKAGQHFYTAGPGRSGPMVWSIEAVRSALLGQSARAARSPEVYARRRA